jgi:TetR/AcrR family transcriptional regulator, tetracycline repressor protein
VRGIMNKLPSGSYLAFSDSTTEEPHWTRHWPTSRRRSTCGLRRSEVARQRIGRKAAPPPPLTRREVVDEALAFVDAEGVDALTMRKLADRLGVYPTAVYWHTGSKAALLAAVCERAFAEMRLPPADAGRWQDWLRAMARSARATLHAHPNIVPVMSSQLQVTTSSFPLAENVLAVLEGAGFHGEQLTDAYNTVIGCVFGFLFGELSAEPPEADRNWARDFRRRLESVDPTVAPTLAANLPIVAGNAFMLRWESGRHRPMQSGFEMALDVLVAGLEAVLRRSDV